MRQVYAATFDDGTFELGVANFPLELLAGCNPDHVVSMRDQAAGRDLSREEIADLIQAARDAEEILAEYADDFRSQP